MNITSFSYFVYFAIVGVQTTYLPNYYMKYHGFSGKHISLMFAGNMLFGVCSHVVWGQIADRSRCSAALLRIGSICILIVYFLLSIINNIWIAALLFWSLGFFMTAMPALLDTITITNYPIKNYGNIRLWGSVGYGSAVLVIPFIIPKDYSPIFFITVLAFVYSIALIFIHEEKRENHTEIVKKIYILEILKIPGLLPFLFFSLLHWCAHISYNLCLDIHRDLLGLPFYVTGVAICTGICCEIFCMARISKWFEKINSYKVWFMIIATASAFRWSTMGYSLNISTFIAVQIFQGFTFGAFFTISVTYLRKVVPQDMLTSGQNIFYITTFSLGGFIGTFLCGAMLDSVGKGFYVFLCSAVISILSLIQCLFLTDDVSASNSS
ncbi:MFS transporter [Candidatus Uabimicrobium sp. HlEnr_7]|uniref:MFS transporter n=1 Tax=Candidatus Uabimicrobium helgolandensis TaxID=3095367 RepID=UPI0035588C57